MAEGRSPVTLKGFFEELGAERLAGIEVVTMDLSAAYQKAVRQALPGAQIVFDKFRLAQLAQRTLDEVRRALVRELPPEQRQPLKKTRWILLKNPDDLDPRQLDKLASIQRSNHRLYRSYLLQESFLDLLARDTTQEAKARLKDWLAWASRCRR